MTPEQRFEQIERNIQVITDLAVQSAERQSITEHQLQVLTKKVTKAEDQISRLTETMHRLANIEIRHEERLDALDGGDEDEGSSA